MIHINTGFDLDAVYNNEEARRKKIADEEAARARKDLLKGKLEGSRQPAQPPTPPTGQGGLIEKVSDGIYLLPNLPYAGTILPATEFTTTPLDNGQTKTQANWAKRNSPDKFIVPDAELLYQVMHRTYNLRDHTQYKTLAKEIQQALQPLFDQNWLMTLTNIKYNIGLDATINRLAPLTGKTPATKIQIPTFPNEYTVLAPQQAENKLGTTQPPQEATPTLQAILGADHNDAGNVFQYFASRKDGELRETRLWTPDQKSRKEYPERVVCLGVCSGRFGLGAGDSIDDDWPALGVRQAQKISSGNKGAP